MIELVYFLTALLFIVGLKRMSQPNTARSGIQWAGIAMVLATFFTFFKGLDNLGLIVLALGLGTFTAWTSAKRVSMTDMPQMVAIYNGMGGGAAAAIAWVELLKDDFHALPLKLLALLGGLIGGVAFGGSVIAFLKLDGRMQQKPMTFTGQQQVNFMVLLATIALGFVISLFSTNVFTSFLILLFFVGAVGYGAMLALPIGGADMPVVISLFNAFTGLAVGFEGFALGNPAMIVAGVVVGAAGTLLTQLMAKAMNRSIPSVLFGAFGATEDSGASVEGSLKAIDADDAAIQLAYADRVVIVPGYGMAVAQAQHKIRELCDLLEKRGVKIQYAIHPVAGRMPGHMNVLLAEAGVPYEQLYDLEDINPEFKQSDVSIVIGANDVVNPAAHRQGSPLYGMPILEVEDSKNVLVIKRGQGKGFAGVENELFYKDNTRMLYGDAQDVAGKLIQALKKL